MKKKDTRRIPVAHPHGSSTTQARFEQHTRAVRSKDKQPNKRLYDRRLRKVIKINKQQTTKKPSNRFLNTWLFRCLNSGLKQ